MLLDNRRMIRLGQCLIAAGTALLLLPFGGSHGLLPAFFLIGLGCAPIFPSLLHETPENFGKEYSQAMIGIQMASAYIGTMLMPPLFGAIAAHTGFAIFPACIALVLLIMTGMVEILHRTIDGQKPGRRPRRRDA
jgi:fucose permease